MQVLQSSVPRLHPFVLYFNVKLNDYYFGWFYYFFFFFFKQKTAYEIGTGDWSSDVCSSDL